MTVILLHPTDELFFANLQKELTECLFKEDRILYQNTPLWIELGELELDGKKLIKKVEIGEMEICENSVICPVTVILENKQISSKLTLVSVYKGDNILNSEITIQKNKPIRQLKVFRLGIMQNEGPHAKSISKSVWCKLK